MTFRAGVVVLASAMILIRGGGNTSTGTVSNEQDLDPVLIPTQTFTPVSRGQLSVQTLAGGFDTPWAWPFIQIFPLRLIYILYTLTIMVAMISEIG